MVLTDDLDNLYKAPAVEPFAAIIPPGLPIVIFSRRPGVVWGDRDSSILS